MERQATEGYPFETGGILVGYLTEGVTVITRVIGPGPNARFDRDRFFPDSLYQERVLASIYETSGRLYTYLGDWHTHPDGITKLSRTDRRTLRRIARTKSARIHEPIMMLLAGGPESWKAGLFRLFEPQCFWSIRRLHCLEIKVYD
ncbi:Mov34/MPN/PAD-1 family protein [Billgrantia sulfidoxydans]